MSRHRNIRNANYYDDYDDDDDYDYDDHYDEYDEMCISPGTQQQYTYQRSNDFPTIQPQQPKQVCQPQPEEKLVKEKQTLKQPQQHIAACDEEISSCIDAIQNVLGDNFTDDIILAVSRKFNGNSERSIDYLLDSSNNVQSLYEEMKELENNVKVLKSTNKHQETPTKVQKMTEDLNKVKLIVDKPTVATPKKAAKVFMTPEVNKEQARTSSPAPTPKKKIDYANEYRKRHPNEKKDLSLVVIGHVDAGKSTLMGNLLYQTGVVSKQQIHKYEQDSKKVGKSSFAYAWVLDETPEERNRGITMDIASHSFETKTQNIMLMDAPGHRDFIPNMLTGASQADVALLVVGSSKGEFESGFGQGGQTREHAMLVRTLGIQQLAVAVNKLDMMEWSQQRYNEIVKKLKTFLKQAGFRDNDVTFVPVSGLHGDNLVEKSSNTNLTSWYKGPCLLEVIDKFQAPMRSVEFPLRFVVNDVYKNQNQTGGLSLYGKIESGGIVPNTKVVIMPSREKGLVKKIEMKGVNEEVAICGQHATIQVNGVKNQNEILIGSIVCCPYDPIPTATNIAARIVVFEPKIPIYKGSQVELHYKSLSTPATVSKLRNLIDKNTGVVLQKKPRFLNKGNTATIELKTNRTICVEEYEKLKEMGRLTLRYSGSTIAAGVISRIIK